MTPFLRRALLAIVLATPCAVVAKEAITYPLLINSQCDVCPIAHMRTASLTMQSSFRDGTNGVTFKLVMKGVRLDNVPGNVLVGVRAAVSMKDPNTNPPGPCTLIRSPTFSIIDGNTTLAWTGEDTEPVIEESRLPLELCEAAFVHTATESILVTSIRRGVDND
jgi:hypothetical protein